MQHIRGGAPRPRSGRRIGPSAAAALKAEPNQDLDTILRLEAEHPIHILRAASFTGFRGDRCVRHYRQVIIHPTTKNS